MDIFFDWQKRKKKSKKKKKVGTRKENGEKEKCHLHHSLLKYRNLYGNDHRQTTLPLLSPRWYVLWPAFIGCDRRANSSLPLGNRQVVPRAGLIASEATKDFYDLGDTYFQINLRKTDRLANW